MQIAALLDPRFHRDHRFTRRRLSDYLDGELEQAERARVERHVGMCPRCRALLASLRRTVSGLRGLPPREPRDGVAARIVERLRGP